jgi:DNA helicase-2/ATP-dependent DNA helicase PcrA
MEDWQSVLFLSFSRAAVARIGEAMRQQVPKDQRAMLSMQTFHSFFWSLISTHGYLIGAPKKIKILLPSDEKTYYGSIKKKDRNEDNPAWMSWLWERDRLFTENGLIAFDLFPQNALVLLERSEYIRRLISKKYPLIIVDEAQDTGPEAWKCIELLSRNSQIICLADLEQQIFDHLPGVGPERILAIKAALNPLQIDLGTQNYRSSGTEIAVFGQDILLGQVRGAPYVGVSSVSYNPKTKGQNSALRMSIGILHRAIRKSTGSFARSIAILTHSGASAAKISAALNSGEKPVRHSLAFDEAEAILNARFAAFLLEPKSVSCRLDDLACALELLASAKKAAGRASATKWQEWALNVRAGKVSNAGFVQNVLGLIDTMRANNLVGDPAKDWNFVKRELHKTQDKELIEVARNLDYLVAFNRGRLISAGLGGVWVRDGQYTGARDVLDTALAQDQMLNGVDDPPGIQVMTIHKSKGKQFDGVIVVREGRHNGQNLESSFIWWGDVPPYQRSRKILRVAVTRAKYHTLLLQHLYPGCPIVGRHRL